MIISTYLFSFAQWNIFVLWFSLQYQCRHSWILSLLYLGGCIFNFIFCSSLTYTGAELFNLYYLTAHLYLSLNYRGAVKFCFICIIIYELKQDTSWYKQTIMIRLLFAVRKTKGFPQKGFYLKIVFSKT